MVALIKLVLAFPQSRSGLSGVQYEISHVDVSDNKVTKVNHYATFRKCVFVEISNERDLKSFLDNRVKGLT